MYSGIIQGVFPVTSIDKKEDFLTLGIELDEALLKDLKIGASVAVNGVCLTVTKVQNQNVFFDLMQETLNLTTLDTLLVGEKVNIERSLKFGDEIGGHPLSGHIDTTANITELQKSANNHVITFQIVEKFMSYIFSKGFLGIHGVSLTVINADKKAGTFQVSLIPETLRLTNLGAKQVGDKVNIEIDRQTQVIVDTVREMKL